MMVRFDDVREQLARVYYMEVLRGDAPRFDWQKSCQRTHLAARVSVQ